MKSIFVTALLLFCSPTFAECTVEQSNSAIDIKVQHIENGIRAGGNHGYMDEIHISAPAIFMDIPLAAMELTEGEVSSFWVPVAFTITNGVAQTTISGYKESIKDFEMAIYYESKQCKRSVQRAI